MKKGMKKGMKKIEKRGFKSWLKRNFYKNPKTWTLRPWVVNVLLFVFWGYVFTMGTCIDGLLETGNKVGHLIVIVWGILFLISFKLLKTYTKIFG